MLYFSSSVASISSPVLLPSEDKALWPSPEPVLQFLFHSQVGRSRRPCLVFTRMEANMSRCFKNKFYLREDKSVQTSSKERKLEGDKLPGKRQVQALVLSFNFIPSSITCFCLSSPLWPDNEFGCPRNSTIKLFLSVASISCCHGGFLLDKGEDSSSMELPIGLMQAVSPQLICSPFFLVCFGFL